jgi:hypothetical protein
MPAVSAASFPKLRDRLTMRTRRSARLRSNRRAKVSSREPSFTNTISKRTSSRSSIGVTVSRKRSIVSSSLNTGTTSDSSGSAGRRARCTASWCSSATSRLVGLSLVKGRLCSGTTTVRERLS